MQNALQSSFYSQFKVGANGISEFTTQQIQAKAAVLGLTDELTYQAMAMANDADFVTKSRAQRLTWGAAIKDNSVDLNDLGNAFKKTNKISAKDLDELEDFMSSGNRTAYRNKLSNLINTAGVADDIIDIGNASQKSTKQVSRFGTTLTGAFASLATLAANPVTWIVAAGALAGGLFAVLNDSFDKMLKESQDATAEYQESYTALTSLSAELDNVNAQIAELESHDKLSLTDEAQLESLRLQSAELERQVELKERLTNVEAREAADAAKDALSKKGYMDLTLQTKSNASLAEMGSAYEDSTIITATQNEIARYKELQAEREKLLSERQDDNISKSRKKEIDSQIDEIDQEYNRLESVINDNVTSISSLRDSLTDQATGAAMTGYESEYNQLTSLIDAWNNVDLSPAQQRLKAIESFFSTDSGHNYIKDQLTEIAAEGGNAADAFLKMGLSLDGLNLDKDAFNQYFSELANGAEEAAQAIDSIDGSVAGVTSAFEKENQDANWNTMAEYAANAKELFESGKIGTDDFQSVVQFLTKDVIDANETLFDADAYVAKWEEAQKKIAKYFDSENPMQSAINAQDKLLESNLFKMDTDSQGKEFVKLADGFTSSAQAAEAFGVSVEAADVILHNLESYGYEFDDNFIFAGEEFSRYTNALQNIKDLRDEMSEGDTKNRLSDMIEGWDANYEEVQADLTKLKDDKVIVSIEFEYSLAQIQQEIDKLQNLQQEQGWDVETGAELNAAKRAYRDQSETREGSGIANLQEYQAASDAISGLQNKLVNASNSQKEEIQQQISLIYDAQNALNDAFASSGKSWDEFIKTDEYASSISEMSDQVSSAKNEIAELLGISPESITIGVDADVSEAQDKLNGIGASDGKTIVMSVDATTEQIDRQIGQLKEDQTLTFKAVVDNESSIVNAFVDEEGEIHYTAVVDDEEVELTKRGNLFYTGEVVGIETPTGTQGTVDVNARAVGSVDTSGVADPTIQLQPVIPTNINIGQPLLSANVAIGGIDPIPKQNAIADVSLGDYPTTIPSLKSSVNVSLGTYPTYIPSITQTVYRNYVDRNKFNGSAHYSGTARHTGSAFASGDWSIPKDEKALVGELGTETVVRDGKYFTVGDRGAEFVNLKRGDIVFNHKQSEELFKNGYVTSGGGRAKVVGGAFAQGSAYASGGRPIGSYGGSGSSGSGSSESKSYSSTTKSASKSVSSVAQAATKATEDLFDFVEIYLSRQADLTEKAKDAIEDAVGLADKMTKNQSAISQIQKEISANQAAANKYMAQANAVGLSESYASKVRNGSLDIKSITDETLRDQIDEYKKWYDASKEAKDAVAELRREEQSLAIERLEYIEDYYDLVKSVKEALQDANETALEYNEIMGFSAVSDEVKKTIQLSISAAEEIYNAMSQQLTDYEIEFKQLVDNGYIKKGSDAYLEAQAKLNEMIQAVDEAAISLVEFEDKLRDIEYTKIQYVIDGLERAVDKIDAKISLDEARDQIPLEEDYTTQIDRNNANIREQMSKREKLLEEQSLYAVDSARYQELAEEINDVDTEIYGLLETNEELKDSIFEIRFQPLDDLISRYEDLESELDSFRSLLNEDAFFDKTGGITSEGLANIAMLQQSMIVAKQKIADYTEGLNKLQESYDNNLISEKEFYDKSLEYREGLQDAVIDVKDYEDALKDLYITQMSTEVDYLKEVIEKRKEALQTKEDYYNYDKQIKSQTKDVNAIKAQIAALEGVNNISAQAELKRLQAQLADAEETLAETKREHSIEVQETGYDSMSERLDTILEDTEYEITHNAEKQQEVISNMLDNVVGMYAQAYDKINSIIANTGWVGSNEFNSGKDSISTSAGAQNQNTQATTKPSDTNPSGTASSTVTSPVDNDDSYHNTVEEEIKKEPNTTDRKVAELKTSKKSVSVQEGQQATVTTSIRPTDAANQSLLWASSNTSVATVSGGVIKGIKPGGCTVTVSTMDGSNISVKISVTVTKKPDPPKPSKPPTSSSGDGVPRVGDVVTYKGKYYYDSWGVTPVGNMYSGVKGGVVIDGYSASKYGGSARSTGGYDVHIRSADGKYGNLGWVSLSQLSGYRVGTRNASYGWHRTDEEGHELKFRQVDVNGKRYTLTDTGDQVMRASMTDRLFEFAKDPANFIKYHSDSISSAPYVNSSSPITTVNVDYQINIGEATDDNINKLRDMMKNEMIKYVTKEYVKEFKKIR